MGYFHVESKVTAVNNNMVSTNTSGYNIYVLYKAYMVMHDQEPMYQFYFNKKKCLYLTDTNNYWPNKNKMYQALYIAIERAHLQLTLHYPLPLPLPIPSSRELQSLQTNIYSKISVSEPKWNV